MGAAARQQRYRKRVKDNGMADIRVEIPLATRDKIKALARSRNQTMKDEIRQALETLSNTQVA